MDERLSINVAIIGAVSVGKSTLINTLFVDQYSDMKIKRTTAIPQVYHETDNKLKQSDLTKIRESNRTINEEIMKKTEKGGKLEYKDITEINYSVPPIYDMLKLKKNVFLSIYDLPGLNDSLTKDVYFRYVNENFHKFDIIVFVLDIHSGINTTDELEIMKLIIQNIKSNKEKYTIKTEILVLLNKCDELEEKDGKLVPKDEELTDMAGQAVNIIDTTIKDLYPELKYNIQPISCEDSYIYRMLKRDPKTRLDDKYINKFGANEYGKTRWNKLPEDKKAKQIEKLFREFDYEDRIRGTGFRAFTNRLAEILTDANQYTYLVNHVRYDLSQITDNKKLDISEELDRFLMCKNKLRKIAEYYNRNTTVALLIFDEYYDKFMDQYKKNNVAGLVTETPQTKEKFNIYKTVQNIFSKVRSYFADLWPKHMKESSEVTKQINQYYINCLNNFELDSDEMLENFDRLVENEYSGFSELFHDRASSLLKYKDFRSDAAKNENKSLDFLLKMEKRYNIPKGAMLEIMFNIVGDKISIIRRGIYFHLIHHYAKFWKQVIVKSNNTFYDHVNLMNSILSNMVSISLGTGEIDFRKVKQSVDTNAKIKMNAKTVTKATTKTGDKKKTRASLDVENSNDNKTEKNTADNGINMMLEEEIYHRLKGFYPTEIYTYNEIMEQIGKKDVIEDGETEEGAVDADTMKSPVAGYKVMTEGETDEGSLSEEIERELE